MSFTGVMPEDSALGKDNKLMHTNKMSFKTIYLLTDFSDHARNAALYAIQTFGAEVKYILINSFVVHTSAATLIDLEGIAHQESVNGLEEEAKEIKAALTNLNIDLVTHSKYGTPVDVINGYMEKLAADLVVVGSKGISKLDEILIGSVTTAIMRGVSVPVLSVPIKAKAGVLDKIVMASDLANANKGGVVETLQKFKKHFNAQVSGVTVKTDKGQLTAEEQLLLTKLEEVESLDQISVLENKNISKALMDYCDQTKTDLLVVVAKHTSFFKRFFHKSITKELVNHEVLPILVLDDN